MVEHVLMVNARRFVQLVAAGGSVLSSSHLLMDIRMPAGKERVRLDAIAAFNVLASGRSSGVRMRNLPGAPRLRFILQALDGYLAGRSHRAIAEAMLGAPRVRQNWGNPGEHLRDQIRRAVRRGRMLMAGGYVSLLR
jgi:hypothetical protein